MRTVRIHITGDYICDWSISRPDYIPDGYFDRSDATQLHVRGGGAWYLEHLIGSVSCADLKPRAKKARRSTRLVFTDRKLKEINELFGLPADNVRTIAHAYSLWTRVDRETGAKGKPPKVWRVSQLLGSRPLGKERFKQDPKFRKKADILVVEDLNLGYAEERNHAAWEQALDKLKSGGQLVLKHGSPGPERPFWKYILNQKEARGLGLTVVISAAALRARNAALTRAASWDKTLSDIQCELASGGSSRDLARADRVVVHYGASAVAVFAGKELDTFIFRPHELEGTWEETHPGKIFGVGSILTATLVRHLVDPASYPLFTAVAQALAAHRRAHLAGGGDDKHELKVDLAYGPRGKGNTGKEPPRAVDCIVPITQAQFQEFKKKIEEEKKAKQDKKAGKKYPFIAALDEFRAAWNPTKMPVWREKASAEKCLGCGGSRLLCNVTGPYREALISIAAEVVRRGIDPTLGSVPKARYGDFVSVDRREVESVNEIRRLILNYRDDAHIKRPLCIAVFGSPGAGKSFAIREVSREILGDRKPLEFNLSQMHGHEDLHKAFHQVRDASIRQEIPLVFWDEFDANNMEWLASFLAPMHDAEFSDGSIKHRFGKTIFIFAGGTCHTFEKFCRWQPPEAQTQAGEGVDYAEPAAERWAAEALIPPVICEDCEPASRTGEDRMQEIDPHPKFKERKGPDFISRLRGYVDILGPNPSSQSDHTHVLRRAIILRIEIERSHPELIDRDQIAQISPDIVEAFLRVEKYLHGARSISAVLDMSSLAGEHKFTISALPSPDILALHVSDDFLDARGLPQDVTERLAIAGHRGWYTARRSQGYKYGEVRNDDPAKGDLTHPDMRNWKNLPPDKQQRNRDCVPGRILILRRLGYSPTLKEGGKAVQKLANKKVAELADRFSGEEHLRWLSEQLVQGWEKGGSTRDHLRRHTDICMFSGLKKKSKAINVSIAKHTIRELEACGYELENQQTKAPV